MTLQDSQVELETYRQTRQGLDEMYSVVWKQYEEEKRIRQVRLNTNRCNNNHCVEPITKLPAHFDQSGAAEGAGAADRSEEGNGHGHEASGEGHS